MDVLSNKITEEERKALKDLNVSDSIRYLDKRGYARADIARIIDRRYQHVRNVLIATENRQAGRKKVTFTLVGDVYRKFETRLDQLGQKRDEFLAELLPDALNSLAEAKANSEATLEILEDIFDISTYDDAQEVTFILSTDLLEKMDELCEAKGLPRELFIDWVISAADHSLARAIGLLEDPVGAYIDTGADFCGDYLMTDEDAIELRESVDNELKLAQAIANVKGISVYSAQISLRQLSPEKQNALRQNPKIKDQLKRIQVSDIDPVSLDELIK